MQLQSTYLVHNKCPVTEIAAIRDTNVRDIFVDPAGFFTELLGLTHNTTNKDVEGGAEIALLVYIHNYLY